MYPDKYGIYNNSYVYYNNRYDFGYCVGILFEYKQIIIEANYSKSIKPIGNLSEWDFNQDKIIVNDNVRFYNNNIIVSFGYKIFNSSKK